MAVDTLRDGSGDPPVRSATGAGRHHRRADRKGFASDDLATKEFVRAEIADLRTDMTRQMGELRAELHKEMGLLSWKTAGMLLLQAGLVATLTRLL